MHTDEQTDRTIWDKLLANSGTGGYNCRNDASKTNVSIQKQLTWNMSDMLLFNQCLKA